MSVSGKTLVSVSVVVDSASAGVPEFASARTVSESRTETIIVPFSVERSCGELLDEVKRRVCHSPLLGERIARELSALRVGSIDGGALCGSDSLSDIVESGNMKDSRGLSLFATSSNVAIASNTGPIPDCEVGDVLHSGLPRLLFPKRGAQKEVSEVPTVTFADSKVDLAQNSTDSNNADVSAPESQAQIAAEENAESEYSDESSKSGSDDEDEYDDMLADGADIHMTYCDLVKKEERQQPGSEKQPMCRSEPCSPSRVPDYSERGAEGVVVRTTSPKPRASSELATYYAERVNERRVECFVRSAREELEIVPRGTRVLTPCFELAGFPDMGLVFYLNGNVSSRAGFCSLGLRAPKGVRLRYKLMVGRTERFTEMRSDVTESWGFVDMAKPEDEIDEDGVLFFGVELIDSITLGESLSPDPVPQEASIQATPGAERNGKKTDGSNRPSVGSLADAVSLPAKQEWTLRNMKTKLNYYSQDIPMFSGAFSLAGVPNLRLKFYPNGCKGSVKDRCALFVEAPRGCEMRCRLSVGSVHWTFEKLEAFGQSKMWGCASLCDPRSEIDEDDSLTIGLEILELGVDRSILTEAEEKWMSTQPTEVQKSIVSSLRRVERVKSERDSNQMPLRIRIATMDIPDATKAAILAKIESLQCEAGINVLGSQGAGDSHLGPAAGLGVDGAKARKWLEGLLQLPLGTYLPPPLCEAKDGASRLSDDPESAKRVADFIGKSRSALDRTVYGHEEAKRRIGEILCRWITNPDAKQSLVLGIEGPPGNGKTTLCRYGIAEALGRPLVQINLGGASDATTLEGHGYTYVGSTWGRIAHALMEARCMNPVIYLDELDKVSNTPRGEEVVGILTHLTDSTQNSSFSDKYFDGIPLDLSKAVLVFTFNDAAKLNPVLRDRLTLIRTAGFSPKDRLAIANEHLLPSLLTNTGMSKTALTVPSVDTLLHIESKYSSHADELGSSCDAANKSSELSGVRSTKHALEEVVLAANQKRFTDPAFGTLVRCGAIELNKSVVDSLVSTKKVSERALLAKSVAAAMYC